MGNTGLAVGSTQVREWVEALAPGTLFHLDAVPGTRRAKQNALSRLVNKPNSQLKRVAHGFYELTQLKTIDGAWIAQKDRPTIARMHLHNRPGSGWGWISATNKVGWVRQVSLTDFVAVMRDRHGNVPRPPMRGLRYLRRSNRRRQELNWAEVSVLEALRDYQILGLRDSPDEMEWEWAMELFTSGSYWDNYGSQVNLERLEWAAATEPAKHRDTIFRGLPEVVKAVEKMRAEQPEVRAAQSA